MKKQVTIYNRFTDSFLKKRGWVPNQYLLISFNIHKYLFLLVFAVIHVGVAESQVLEKYVEEAIENNSALQGSFKVYQASLEKSNQVSLESPQLNI
ncbi:MAG: TolC family protein, partial [Cyclobacteriaceae bacterium]|nr:TolC family protein [Cyclobacteriaceae bacterium]